MQTCILKYSPESTVHTEIDYQTTHGRMLLLLNNKKKKLETLWTDKELYYIIFTLFWKIVLKTFFMKYIILFYFDLFFIKKNIVTFTMSAQAAFFKVDVFELK